MNTSKLSMLQHQCDNINVITPIPPSKPPNRQKPQKPQKSLTAKNPKNPTPKISAPKIPDQQKFPQQQNKNPTNYNLFSQYHNQSLLDNL
jgi:hypothetical protein